MGTLVFWGIAVSYLFAANRDRTNALVGAAILLPYNQYLPVSGVPLLNVHALVMLGLLWALMRRNPEWPINQGRPTAPLALGVFALFLTTGFVLGHTTEVPLKYSMLWDEQRLIRLYRDKLSVLFFCYAAFKICDNIAILKRVFIGAVIGFGIEISFCFAELILKQAKVTGHMQAKNATGAFLATYAGVAFGVYLAAPWLKRRRWLFAGLAFAGVLATLGTRSRGGILAVSLTLFAASFLKNKAVFLLLIAAAATSPFWVPEATLEKFEEAVNEGEEGLELTTTAAERIEIWLAGLEAVPDYPMGVGLGNFKMIVPGYGGLEQKLWWATKDAHNEFVLVLVELGIPALLTYMLLLGTLGIRAWQVSSRDEDPFARAIGYGTLFGMMGGIGASLMLSLILRSDISGIMWILMGVCARRAADLSTVARTTKRPVILSATPSAGAGPKARDERVEDKGAGAA
jgi:O-antigen ligase